MKLLVVCCLLFALAIAQEDNEVFRYADEETKQSHYMLGEPGTAVEGGWDFETPEGKSFRMTYKADEGGFQPQADYIPMPVEDTEEVAQAKSLFYSMFEDTQNKLEQMHEEEEQEGKVVEVREKRDAYKGRRYYSHFRRRPYFYRHHMMKDQADDMDQQEETLYTFNPRTGFRPVKSDDQDQGEEVMPEEDKYYKFVPYTGFVLDEEDLPMEKKFKFIPYKGFVPAELVEKVEQEDKHYKYIPYYGFVPADQEQKGYKFVPHYGFVPADKEQKQFKFVPYKGYVPVDEDSDMEAEMEKKYKFVPYRGFVPVEQEEVMVKEEEEEPKEEVAIRRAKRSGYYYQHLQNYNHFLPQVHPYYFPHYGNKKDNVEDEMNEEDEKKLQYYLHPYFGYLPVQEKEEKFYKYVPYVGFVPLEDKEEEEQKKYKFVPYVGFVPADLNEEDQEEEPELMTKTEQTQYKFVPYFGYVPVTNKDDDDKPEEVPQNYYFNPFSGYVKPNSEVEEEKNKPFVYFGPNYYHHQFKHQDQDKDEQEGQQVYQYQPHYLQRPYFYQPAFKTQEMPIEAPMAKEVEEDLEEGFAEAEPTLNIRQGVVERKRRSPDDPEVKEKVVPQYVNPYSYYYPHQTFPQVYTAPEDQHKEDDQETKKYIYYTSPFGVYPVEVKEQDKPVEQPQQQPFVYNYNQFGFPHYQQQPFYYPQYPQFIYTDGPQVVPAVVQTEEEEEKKEENVDQKTPETQQEVVLQQQVPPVHVVHPIGAVSGIIPVHPIHVHNPILFNPPAVLGQQPVLVPETPLSEVDFPVFPDDPGQNELGVEDF